METTITMTVNGQKRVVVTEPDRSLLEVLREDLKLTGTKYGCGEGQCRACTVLLEGKAVAACTTPVIEADQQTVVTIEGLAKGETLHPVQEAFLAEHAFQCGFCTPGMIMAGIDIVRRHGQPDEATIRKELVGNICRCTGYHNIVRAIAAGAKDMAVQA